MKKTHLFFLFATSLALLSSCSSVPRQDAPVEDRTTGRVDLPDETGSQTSSNQSQSSKTGDPIVVAGLQQDAIELKKQGEPAKAAAVLERAIRIQPRNPTLWHQLADVRYSQQKYAQAESLALRSNGYAATNDAIRHKNWLLIAEARAKQGNHKGARAAREQAVQ